MSILEAFLAGKEARRVADAQEQINAMQSFIGQNGQAIMAGDQNALGQLAGFGAEGLQTAMGIQDNLDVRQDRAYNRDRAKVEDGRSDERWRLEVEEYKKGLTAEQAAQEAAVYENAAKMALTATSPEQWDKLATENGAPELVGQFDNRQAVAARFMTTAEVLKATNPDPAKAPETKMVKLADGSEVMVQWNPQTQAWDPAPIPQGGTTGAGKKLTESQSKLTLFQTLQAETAPVLVDLEKTFDPANLADPSLAKLPIAGNYFTSSEYQMYTTAAAAWAEGALRIATGAAATQPEIERNIKTYFAQPGDTPETVAFKAKMREMYARAVNNALGQPDTGERLPTPTEFAEKIPGSTGAIKPEGKPKGPVVVDGFTIEAIE